MHAPRAAATIVRQEHLEQPRRQQRYITHRVPRDFIATYGFDVRDWEGFEVLQGIRDLKLIAGVFPRAGSPPAVRAEFTRRIASLRAGRRFQRWQTIRRYGRTSGGCVDPP
jgi:hypothetical protein